MPFYSQTWSASDKKAAKAGRLESLPLLEKDPLRANPTQFLRNNVSRKKLLVFHTSGSTGTPIATYWTTRELRSTTALREARSTGWAGVSFNLPRATFSGRLVEPNPDSSGPYYRYNRAEKQVYFSAFHLRPDTARDYVKALHHHHVQWLTGYAVSLFILATFILEQKLELPRLKAVITTSEKLTHEMRDVMQQAYACQVFEEYSTVENVLFAHDCEKGRLHVSPDAGVIEILRPDGSPCEPGETGEVVATGLIRTYSRSSAFDWETWQPGVQIPVLAAEQHRCCRKSLVVWKTWLLAQMVGKWFASTVSSSASRLSGKGKSSRKRWIISMSKSYRLEN